MELGAFVEVFSRFPYTNEKSVYPSLRVFHLNLNNLIFMKPKFFKVPFRLFVILLAPILLQLIGIFALSRAETPSPSLHWGALGYPDQNPQFSTGFTFNRFTEFNGEGQRFNNIMETIGINFGSFSWTHRIPYVEGLHANLTIGLGPTSNEPTKFFQNEFVHDFLFHIPKVPVGSVRNKFDFMIDGSITKWWAQQVIFAGAGFSTGSLYHEVWGRAGLRHLPILRPIAQTWGSPGGLVQTLLDMIRVSAMTRYGRVYSGAAFQKLAPQSYLAQGSLSIGQFSENNSPTWEIFAGLTVDSGIFVDFLGDALEERYYSLGFKVWRLTFETWNDQINRKDYGPTYGTRLMIDFYPDWPLHLI